MSFDKLAWQRVNRKSNRPRHTSYHRDWRRQKRHAVIAHLGGRCVGENCAWVNEDGSRGCTDWRCLQIDHIRGGGRQERIIYTRSRGTGAYYTDVMKDKTGKYQLLCANCNWIKKYVNDESACPTPS
jgi:hypothetical protein